MSDGATVRQAQVAAQRNRESPRFRIFAFAVFSAAVVGVAMGAAVGRSSVSYQELFVFGAAAAVAGILSVRDVVRCWTDDGASCEIPQQPANRFARTG